MKQEFFDNFEKSIPLPLNRRQYRTELEEQFKDFQGDDYEFFCEYVKARAKDGKLFCDLTWGIHSPDTESAMVIAGAKHFADEFLADETVYDYAKARFREYVALGFECSPFVEEIYLDSFSNWFDSNGHHPIRKAMMEE